MNTALLNSTNCCIISLTREGNKTAKRIKDSIKTRDRIDCFTLKKYSQPGFFSFKDLKTLFKYVFLKYDTIIPVMATGIVVRMITPLLESKASDPGIIVTDVLGKYFIPLISGHLGHANENSKILAKQIGGISIITTASDNLRRPAIDIIAEELGVVIDSLKDAKEVTALIIDKKPIALIGFSKEQIDQLDLDSEQFKSLSYPVNLFDINTHSPLSDKLLTNLQKDFSGIIILSDRDKLVPLGLPTVHLIPETTVIGIGIKRNILGESIIKQIEKLTKEINLSPKSIKVFSTIPRKQNEAGLREAAEFFQAEIEIIPARVVESVEYCFEASTFVKEQTGLTSVSEPCGYIASQNGKCLLKAVRENGMVLSFWQKQKERNINPKIFVVGIGPGAEQMVTSQAQEALISSEVIIGYKTYIDLIKNNKDLREKEFIAMEMRSEKDRVQKAVELADSGKRVSLISSGDPGVYGMAGLLLEESEKRENIDIEIIPGITAANAAAAKLGAPLMNDYCVLSLSDLLTPWELIERRLRAAAEGDFAIVLYNPKSKARTEQIEKARKILLNYRDPLTPVGIVKRIGREGEEIILTNLEEMCQNSIDMLSTIVVGNSKTRFSRDHSRIITPRGYLL